jgi:hypothetical protein
MTLPDGIDRAWLAVIISAVASLSVWGALLLSIYLDHKKKILH